ncbi:creatininase family protein [Thalassoroseus pseudoceratinae]|uniref:creatininase family protein n=1 Tax=Thalassoroseus pseudoceratinae TaxID=2713176 RepID=UPI0014214942|nr:creatininase family protein [Thalassoroseus pseudoceratinae]
MKYMEMTATQLAKVDRQETLVIVPIAAVEQHGPHMPVGTDTVLCTAVAEAAEQELPSQVLVTPTVWLGASSHHLRFGATLDADLDTHITVLCDIAVSLLDDGFTRVLFLNGHGGNVDPMRVAARKLQPMYQNAVIAAGSYWDVAVAEREQLLKGDHKFVGHACEFETALMLHVRPELVDKQFCSNAGELVPSEVGDIFVSRDMTQRTQAGFTGRPDLATAETGEKLFQAIVTNLEATIQSLLSQPLGDSYKDFVS